MELRIILLFLMIYSQMVLSRETVISFDDISQLDRMDMSAIVKDRLQSCPSKDVRLVFPKNIYHFKPRGAFRKLCSITNHENGDKNIAFLLDRFENITIEGNNSEFIFHDEIAPFIISKCTNITIKDIVIDWDIPFYLQGEIISVDPIHKTYDVKLYDEGFSYKVQDEKLIFPSADRVVFSGIGESLIFDKQTKSPVANAGRFDFHRKKDVPVKQIDNSLIRFYEELPTETPIGGVMTFKGPMGENRYAPAIHAIHSKNINIENVTVHHALGMGFLGERTEDIELKDFNVCLREGSDRFISATADATHFCNCKGKVLVEDCLFENMLDDGTNVHGTYVEIDSIVDNKSVIARLKHFQQSGFTFGQSGEKVWFIIAPDRQRTSENEISEYEPITDMLMKITFTNQLPPNLKRGDLIENKTWNTDLFVLRGCTIKNHRARNIVLKTPGKTFIENNYLNSMMASILLRGEGAFWFESGANENVTIRNNYFDRCSYGGKEHAVLHIMPRFSKNFDKKDLFDKNIILKSNVFNLVNKRAVEAHSVDGLKIQNNIFKSNSDGLIPGIYIHRCKDVQLKENKLSRLKRIEVKISDQDLNSLQLYNNVGFEINNK